MCYIPSSVIVFKNSWQVLFIGFPKAVITKCHKLDGLKQQELVTSQFCRLEDWIPGMGKAMFPLKPYRVVLATSRPGFSLAHSSIIPASASHPMIHATNLCIFFPVCVSVSKFPLFIRTPVIMVEGVYSWSCLNLSIQSPLVICEGLLPGPTWIPKSRDAQVTTVNLPYLWICIFRFNPSYPRFHLQSVRWVDGVPTEEGWMCSQRSYWLKEVMFTGTKGWLGLQYIFWQWHNSTHIMLLDQNN